MATSRGEKTSERAREDPSLPGSPLFPPVISAPAERNPRPPPLAHIVSAELEGVSMGPAHTRRE